MGVRPGWHIRLTLPAMVLVPLGAAVRGFDVGSVVRVALVALAVAIWSRPFEGYEATR